MSLLDDTALFTAIAHQGGFSHAARHLGLSNGLISRRIALLEKQVGVTLIKRTTRQIQLTPEGEIFLKHAERIQQELQSALSLIQTSAKKPRGTIRLGAPIYFGRYYLGAIISKFLTNYDEINIELILTGTIQDPIKERLDLAIRGAGFIDKAALESSNLKAKLLVREKIGLYASHEYLYCHGEPKSPEDLKKHSFIHYLDIKSATKNISLTYSHQGKQNILALKPKFNCNDIDTNIMMCIAGHGIGRFTDLNIKESLQEKKLRPILQEYDFGNYYLYAVYPQQHNLPSRTRLLLEFIAASLSTPDNLKEIIGSFD